MHTTEIKQNPGKEKFAESAARSSGQQVQLAEIQDAQTQPQLDHAAHGAHQPVSQQDPISQQDNAQQDKAQQDKTQQKFKKKKKPAAGDKSSAEDSVSEQADADTNSATASNRQEQSHDNTVHGAADTQQSGNPQSAMQASNTQGEVHVQDNTTAGAENAAAASKPYVAENTARAHLVSSDAGVRVAGSGSGAALEPSAHAVLTPAVGHGANGMFGWALAGLSLLGMGAAAGGGGGGGGKSGTAENIPSVVPTLPIVISQTSISGVVMAGPVFAGAGLSVKAYALDGSELGRGEVDDQGAYNVALIKDYHGVVRLSLIDGNGNAHDYMDVASLAGKDIADLSAIGIIHAGQANVMMITPLTSVAANKLTAQTLSADEVNAANQAVADLFGLDEILTIAPIAVINQLGEPNLAHANDYGKVLAVLSMAEHKSVHEHAAEKVWKTIGDALPDGTANSVNAKAAKDMLLDALQDAASDGHLDAVSKQVLKDLLMKALSPAAITVELSNDTGLYGDKISNDATMSVTGVSSDNTWEYSLDGGSSWVVGSDNSIPASAFVSDGVKSVLVRQVDFTGNASPVSPAYDFTLDSTAPAPATISLRQDTGNATDNVTSDAEVTVTGLEAGASWEYSLDNGSTWKTGEGSSIPALAFGADGAKSVQVRQTDVAGNVAVSNAFAFTLDTVNPDAPAVALSNDTGSSHDDRLTHDAALTVSGLEAGATWEFSLDNGSTWQAGSGSSIPASEFSSDGHKTVQVRQTDAAGNVSDASADYDFVLDTAAPSLTITITAVAGDNIINKAEAAPNQNVAIEGVATGARPGDRVTTTIDGSNYTGTIEFISIIDPDGSTFSITVPGEVLANLADKKVTVSISSTDDAGNIGSATSAEVSYTVNLTAAAPIISLDNLTADNIINIAEAAGNINLTGTVAGDAQVGDKVTITLGSTSYETTVVNNNGNLEFSLELPGAELQLHTSISATVDSHNGSNHGSASARLDYVVDIDAPEPVVTVDAIAVDNIINSHESTHNVNIIGTVSDARAGDVVKTRLNGHDYTGTVAADGSYSISVPGSVLAAWAEKKVTVSVVATDVVGNQATASAEKSYQVDTSKPVAPSVSLTTDSGSSNTDHLTNNAALTVSGLEAGASWEYSLDAGMSWVEGSAHSIPASVFSNDGAKSVLVRQSDIAGNVSDVSAAYHFILDTIAPVPSITTEAGEDNYVNASDTGVDIEISYSNMAVGDVIQLRNGNKNIDMPHTVTVADVSHGNALIHVAKTFLHEGNNSLSVVVTDQAGNSGTSSGKNYILDTIAPVPTITVNHVTSDNILDASEAAGNVSISGKVGGDAKVGDIVTVTVGSHTYHATVLSDKSFSVAVPGSVLVTSTKVSASISTTDLAGNTASKSASLSYALSFSLDLNGATAGTNRQLNASDILAPVQIIPEAAISHANANAQYKSVDIRLTGLAASSDDQLLSGANSQSLTALPQSGSATLTVTAASGSTVWSVVRSGTHYHFVLQDSSIQASKAQVQDLLTSLYIRNASSHPLQGERRYEIVVTDAQDRSSSANSSVTLDNVAPAVDLNGSYVTGNNTAFFMTPGLAAYAMTSPQTLIQETGRIASITIQASSSVVGALDGTSSNKAERLGFSDGSDANGMSASLRIGVAGSLQDSTLISGVKLILTMASNGTLTIIAENATLTQQQASQILQALRYSAETGVLTGQRVFTLNVTDHTGNTGSGSSTVTVNPLGTPTIGLNSASDTGMFDNDQVTSRNGSSNSALIFSGSAAANSSVNIFDDRNGNGVMDTGESLGTATANANGTWSFTLNNTSLSEGQHRISARVGASVTAWLNVTIDTQAPAEIFFMGSSVQLNPLLAGSTDANARVKVELDTDGNLGNGYEVSYELMTDSSGRWTLDTASATPTSGSAYTYTAGQTVNVKATATDLAGNETVRTASSTAQSSLYAISDSQVIEGTSGTREMLFVVTRTGDTADAGSVSFELGEGTSALSGGSNSRNDYSGSTSGKLEFAPGETSRTIKFTINGDNYREVNEKIVVNLKDPVNGNIADGVGVGALNEIDTSKLQAAYGLRDLSPQRNDFAIRVRRSSDNAEQDIGFDADGELNTTALLDFVGTDANAKGYVTTWYDQSGNNRNMTQTNTLMQGVIVDQGKLVTRADGSPAISFNNDRNGGSDDFMSAAGAAAADWKSVIIYAKVQSEADSNGFLFNIGGQSNPTRVSSHYPWAGEYYWDVNGAGSIARLKAPSGNLVDKANDVVMEAHAGRTSAGTLAANYTDATQMIFENGVRVASDGTLKPGTISTASTWYLAQYGNNSTDNETYQKVMFNEFMVYLAKDDSTPSVQTLLGSAVNDVLTFSGESNIRRIDGMGGDDALYLSGAVNLDVTSMAEGMFNIESIRMDNNAANTLTLNNASINANASSTLTMIMDTGDKVVFNGVDYRYAADMHALVIGNAQDNVITSTNGNVRMIGGGGADTFTWLPGQTGHDTLQDYSAAQGDKLDLSRLLEGFTQGDEGLFIKKEVAKDGQVQVLVDVNGGSTFTPDLTITMMGLSASDPITIMTTQTNSYVL